MMEERQSRGMSLSSSSLCLTFRRSGIKLAAGEPWTAAAGPSSLATSPRERGAIMRVLFSGRIRLVVLLAVTRAGATALAAGARPPGTNGQITFARVNPTLFDTQV